MPTYDYVCQACSHRFEAFQSMTAKHMRKCPECGKLKLKRLIGIGAGVIFKGSGFYETDYRSENYKKDAKADSPNAGDQASQTGDTKSDTGKKADAADTSKTVAADASKTASPKSENKASSKSTQTSSAD